MSSPKRDPDFTMKDLEEEGARFLEAAKAYWEAAHKAGISGAIIWLTGKDGSLALFTRGEYREHLLRNIDCIGPARSFGAMDEK